MKKSLLILMILLVAFTSCVTEKKCNQKFPPKEIIVTNTVIKDSIIYKPIEVPVYIKGDTIHDTTKVTIAHNGLVNSQPVTVETDLAKATAQVRVSRLYLTLVQKDTTFNQRYDSLIKEVYHWKEVASATQTVKAEKVIPKFYQIFAIIGVALIVLLIAYGLFKLNIFKTWLP